jgi:flagellar motor switch protein FliN/FliY
MTRDEAIMRLAESTAEAVSSLLEMFAPGQVSVGEVTIVAPEQDALEHITTPAVATSVSYVDGVTGGNVFVITKEGARRLAAAMMGTEPAELEPGQPVELDEMELSAVSEEMNQMMASAAGATTSVLGTEVEISVPETRAFESPEEALGAYERVPHATRVAFSVCGEPARLIQLLPNAFIVRMTSALDDLGAEYATGDAKPAGAASADAPSLSGIPVRVWAELGRARLPSADVVSLPTGAVVELDRQADEPVDLYVNGKAFATGRLMVVNGTDWAVRIETVFNVPSDA